MIMATMNKKDIVSFACGVFDEKHPQVLAVTPFVNHLSLTEMISDFEKAKSYQPIGGYAGIVPQYFDFAPVEQYFLGKHGLDSFWANLGGEYILGCECGEVGCWPLQWQITVQGGRSGLGAI
jgi:hypothetical protein